MLGVPAGGVSRAGKEKGCLVTFQHCSGSSLLPLNSPLPALYSMAGALGRVCGNPSTLILRTAFRNFSVTTARHQENAAAAAATGIDGKKFPLILDEKFDDCSSVVVPREAWIETLDTSAASPQVGLMHLHPQVFGAFPRLDIIHDNVVWQRKMCMVNTAHTKSRAEVRGGGRKPWPQKGMGRSRHGSIR
ncbi:39S ribosomal protein L4, mitochondrial [Chionoecetes opilio]|uniref:Large ribosomal subunit protein uL4m n=1 Tax=Chionoecetes opilio TaxID=41210 RepID=A0A8J4YB41_CHIOP|nr:39S ribosomal protein L4, mitochondrial [Chionoecetes opilio]